MKETYQEFVKRLKKEYPQYLFSRRVNKYLKRNGTECLKDLEPGIPFIVDEIKLF